MTAASTAQADTRLLPDMRAIREALIAPGARFELTEEMVRGVRMPVFARRFGSLAAMFEHRSEVFADCTYIIDGDERLTFSEHLTRAKAFGRVMQERYGVRPGDRVAIFAANRWEWVVGFWATIAIGAIPCLYNGHWSVDEWIGATELTEPVLLIADSPRLERVKERLGRLPVINLDNDMEVILSDGNGRTEIDPAPVKEDDLSMLVFTSGTTGRPKAVMLPHRALVGATQLLGLAEATKAMAMGGSVPRKGDPLTSNGVVQMVTAPLFHVAMLIAAVLGGMGGGGAMVLMRGRFDEERAIRLVEKEGVTAWSMLGSVATRVASSSALERHDMSSLKQLGMGGAPVSPAVQEKLRRAFPQLSLAMGMGYSSTEAGSASIASAGGEDFLNYPTSTGAIMVTTQVEIRDPQGNALADGEYGEVHVRSPYIMLGYWRNPEATVDVLKPEGWLAMGDVAKIEDGRLYINSRARDLIFVNAENVSPVEVEFALEAHPDIREAAVMAVDDELTGDAVMAVVALVEGGSFDQEALQSWCAKKLAAYKVPTRWHLHEGDLPRTASGKLVKHQIRGLVETTGQRLS